MLSIDCKNNIKVTKGDKAFISFRTGNYKLTKGDNVILSVRGHGQEEAPLFTTQVNEFNNKGVASIVLDVEDTNHDKGEYYYSIRVLTALGVDETVIEGNFIII